MIVLQKLKIGTNGNPAFIKYWNVKNLLLITSSKMGCIVDGGIIT